MRYNDPARVAETTRTAGDIPHKPPRRRKFRILGHDLTALLETHLQIDDFGEPGPSGDKIFLPVFTIWTGRADFRANSALMG